MLSLNRLWRDLVHYDDIPKRNATLIEMRTDLVDVATRMKLDRPDKFNFLGAHEIHNLFFEISFVRERLRRANIVLEIAAAGALVSAFAGAQDGVAIFSMTAFSGVSGVSGLAREIKLTMEDA